MAQEWIINLANVRMLCRSFEPSIRCRDIAISKRQLSFSATVGWLVSVERNVIPFKEGYYADPHKKPLEAYLESQTCWKCMVFAELYEDAGGVGCGL